MLWAPQTGRVKMITNGGIVGSATFGTGLPSNATTLLDGAVTEVISAAANIQDSWGMYIWISETGLAVTASEACVDILIGGATDDVLIPALICGGATIGAADCRYFFPLHIPGGVRIAARLASVRTSITARIIIVLYGGSPPPWKVGRKVTTYGTQINNARGKAVVPSTSGAAESVTEMTASSAEDHFAFLPGFQCSTDTTMGVKVFSIGIGVGASVEDRIGGWWYRTTAGEETIGPIPHTPIFQNVPAGSRLSLLASCSGVLDAAYDGLIYAVS